jgi:hypothetical protein
MTISSQTRSTIGSALALSVALAWLPTAGAAGTAQAADTLRVTVKYTGKGAVDEAHKIWIWLFDTPDIGPASIPIAESSIDKNGATATFTGVALSKVWIAVAYDEGGGFTGNAPPPTGSPVSIHGLESGAPTPVEPGGKTPVAVTFDDSQRMP